MRDTIVYGFLLALWRTWRDLGKETHEDVLTFCVLIVLVSIPLERFEWLHLVAWIWSEHVLGGSKEQLLTLGTIALAVATYGLFARTRDMAMSTKDAIEAAGQEAKMVDKRHQQNLSGIATISSIRLETADQPIPYNPSQGSWTPATGRWSHKVEVFGQLRNIGAGPILSVKMTLEIPAVPFASGTAPFHADLGFRDWKAGDAVDFGFSPGQMPAAFDLIDLSRGLRPGDLVGAIVRLDWTTIFNGHGWETNVVVEPGKIEQQKYLPDYVA